MINLISSKTKLTEENEIAENLEEFSDKQSLTKSEKKKNLGTSSILKAKLMTEVVAESNINGNPIYFIKESTETKQESINQLYNFPKFTKKVTGFDVNSPITNNPISKKIPTEPIEPKHSKKSISLHRKLLSFEEDIENPKPTGFTQIISPLNANKDSIDFDFIENVEKPLNKIESRKILAEERIESLESDRNQGKTRKEAINLKSKLNNDYSENPDESSDFSASSVFSDNEEEVPVEKIIFNTEVNEKSDKSQLKIKGPLIKKKNILDSDDMDENYENATYRSKSQNNRKSMKPPSRPSKSRENEREVITSTEFRTGGKIDRNFVNKMTEKKTFIKDKAIFKKKSKKQIMKNIEKLLESKENQVDDPEIIKLKSMLASRQSFKRKHVELPKDHPYNQRIQAILSDGNTPIEEYRIDPAIVKKREERLKRISSIYSTKKTKDTSTKHKRETGTLSPSKSENVIKRKNILL